MQADFVLSKWNPNEIATVKLKLEKAVEVIENFATTGIERTMNLVNNLSLKQ
jgi:PTH1 family peptidyl-tRNA hydrolase